MTKVVNVPYIDNIPFASPANYVGDSIKVAYFYTADMVSKMANLTLRVEDLMLKDIYTYTYIDNDFPKILNKEITIKALDVTPQRDYSYSPTINFTFGPEGLEKDGIIWAGGNLIYDPVKKVNLINNRPNAKTVSSMYDYWLFYSISPWDSNIIHKDFQQSGSKPEIQDDKDNVWIVAKDPCRAVAGGEWRLPTLAEGLALGGENNSKVVKYQTSDWNTKSEVSCGKTRDFVEVPTDAHVSFKGDDVKWVIFFKSGIIKINIDYSRDPSTFSLNVKDSYFIPAFGVGNGDSFLVLQIDGRPTQTNLARNTLDKRDRLPVRCVKNK